MALSRRDALHHTYADYFSWPDDERYELIDGIAYIKEPPAPSRVHARVMEVWLVHPIDRTLTSHRLESERYGSPVVVELKGRTAISAVPGVSIDWDQLTWE